jgi:hypothetical protein
MSATRIHGFEDSTLPTTLSQPRHTEPPKIRDTDSVPELTAKDSKFFGTTNDNQRGVPYMKLLRYRDRGREKPGLLDDSGAARDRSGHISDFSPETRSQGMCCVG